MTAADLFHETYTSLSGNKVRSALTMLGIVIGIGSVIALTAVGQGAQNSIQNSIQSIGSNLLIITPGAQRTAGVLVSAGRGSARSLTPEDAAAIASQVPGAVAVAEEYSGREQVTAGGQNTNVTVDGVNAAYPQVRNLTISQGGFFTDAESQSLATVAVVGPTVAQDLFGSSTEPIGQSIRVNNILFQVVGVTQTTGSNGFGSSDDEVFIPVDTALQYFAGNGNDYLTTIDVQADSSADMTNVQNGITALLLSRHNISNAALADFSVTNEATIVATASSVTSTFTTLLAAVAGISLLVGGIGIMNMMLTTVTERTREIGLRKAIGAKRSDISLQFLCEAVALTFIGGFVGIVLGWLMAYAATASGLVAASVSLSSILLAFGVSAGIGIVFGYYPARRASMLNPIDALRYE